MPCHLNLRYMVILRWAKVQNTFTDYRPTVHIFTGSLNGGQKRHQHLGHDFWIYYASSCLVGPIQLCSRCRCFYRSSSINISIVWKQTDHDFISSSVRLLEHDIDHLCKIMLLCIHSDMVDYFGKTVQLSRLDNYDLHIRTKLQTVVGLHIK